MGFAPGKMPPGRPLNIGLPYHGVCRNGKIGTFEYPQPTGGSTVLVQHPLHHPQVEDKDTERHWQEYALLSGSDRLIGNAKLTPTQSDQAWIYCDEHYSWIVRWGFIKSGITQTLSIWLEAPFGIVGTSLSMTPRMLASITYTPKSYAGIDQNLTVAGYERQFVASHSKTGAKSYINVGAYYTSGNPWNKTTVPFSPTLSLLGIYGALGIHDSFRITLTGNGSIESGEVGAGIECAITHVATAPDMIITNEFGRVYSGEVPDTGAEAFVSITGDGPEGGPCTGDPTGEIEGTVVQVHKAVWEYWFPLSQVESYEYSDTSTSTLVCKYLYMTDKDGNETALEITSTVSAVETHSGTASGEWTRTYEYAWTGCSYSEKVYTVTETITGSYTWETRREYHRTLNFVIKFAGTETNVSFTKDGTPTSKVTECIAPTYCEFGIFNAAVNWFPPLISEYSCTINGASVPCDTDIIVSMITKNILEVYDEAGIVAKLITPDGVTKTLSTPISANQATYDPGSASITVSTTDTICYV